MIYRKLILTLFACWICVHSSLVQAGAYEDMLHAIRTDDHWTVIDLLKRGVDVDSVSPEGETLLMLASREGKPSVIKAILAGKPRIQARNPRGESALMLAAIMGHTEAVKLLLDANAPVNQSGWTPLIYAAARDRVDIARLLIGKGANVNAAADNGTTALMMAAREGYLQTLLLLLEHGADARYVSPHGHSAMSLAKDRGHKEVEAVLRRAGVEE